MMSNSKRIMNAFSIDVNGFYNISNYYRERDSFYIEKKYWDVLDKAFLLGSNLCQGKNDYISGRTLSICLTIYKHCDIQQHMTFKGFIYSKR